LHAVFVIAAATAAVAGSPVDADQFNRLIKSLHSGCRDLSLIVEGGQSYVGPPSAVPYKVEDYEQGYQTYFVLREDGACFQDLFVRANTGDGVPVRRTSALLNGKLDSLRRVADLNQERRTSKAGKLIEFYDTGSPCRILFLWYFFVLKDASLYQYKFIGWEDVSGHNCLCVRFSFAPSDGNATQPGGRPIDAYSRMFWIDMERGGNALKYESRFGDKLRERVDGIKLEQFVSAAGGKLWVPVEGEYNTFSNGTEFFTSPFFRETYHVLRNSVVVNRELGDAHFTVDSTWTSPAEVGAMKGPPQKTVRLAPIRKEPRIDPASLASRLKETLDQADAQAKRLDASSTHESWEWASVMQALAVVAGSSMLVVAAWQRWRAS
jgi:hypothetical protein